MLDRVVKGLPRTCCKEALQSVRPVCECSLDSWPSVRLSIWACHGNGYSKCDLRVQSARTRVVPTCRIGWGTGIQRALALALLSVCAASGTCRLTIRSSRARFAASCKCYIFSPAQGRKAVRLNSGVRPVQKQMPVNKREAKLGLPFPRLSQPLILATNSVPARAAGTPFLGSASRKERLSALDSGQMSSLVKSTAGTGLTIRSSRARFAASCEFG